jgi:hypothetical protein
VIREETTNANFIVFSFTPGSNPRYENFEKRGSSREKGEEEANSMPHAPVELRTLVMIDTHYIDSC